MDYFIELLQVSLGQRTSLTTTPTEAEWVEIYKESRKQALLGVAFRGVELLPEEQRPHKNLLLNWYATANHIKNKNVLLDTRSVEITKLFDSHGFRTTVLKGQSIALLYEKFGLTACRMSGDIDLLVDGDRDDVVFFLKSMFNVGSVVYHHADVKIFDDVETEVHYLPSYSYNPFRLRKYNKFYRDNKSECFVPNEKGFCSPSLYFNSIYLLLHIYKHIFNEGVGLRQLFDYYLVLSSITPSERVKAMAALKWMGLQRVTSSVMFVIKKVFGASDEILLCPADEKHGAFLLEEISASGNFGQYDSRLTGRDGGNYTVRKLRRLFSIISLSPSEVLWAPFWKLWHFCWRKFKGYL